MAQEPTPAVAGLQIAFPLFGSLSILEIFQMDANPRSCRLCGPNSTSIVGGQALVRRCGTADVKRASGLALQNIAKYLINLDTEMESHAEAQGRRGE